MAIEFGELQPIGGEIRRDSVMLPCSVLEALFSVIPAKAGIQTVENVMRGVDTRRSKGGQHPMRVLTTAHSRIRPLLVHSTFLFEPVAYSDWLVFGVLSQPTTLGPRWNGAGSNAICTCTTSDRTTSGCRNGRSTGTKPTGMTLFARPIITSSSRTIFVSTGSGSTTNRPIWPPSRTKRPSGRSFPRRPAGRN